MLQLDVSDQVTRPREPLGMHIAEMPVVPALVLVIVGRLLPRLSRHNCERRRLRKWTKVEERKGGSQCEARWKLGYVWAKGERRWELEVEVDDVEAKRRGGEGQRLKWLQISGE